jgi:hypothetical protein
LFSGDGSTVAFTLSKASTTNGVAVFVENVRQEPTIAYAVSGTTLTFTAAPVTSSGNNIYVLHHNAVASTANHPAAQDLTAVNGTFTGDITINDGTAADRKILFDGNAVDYHIGLDDSADTLNIGKGSTLGTTTAMTFDTNGIITTPLQPSFLVQPTSMQTNIAASTWTTVIFGTERYDTNGDFASNVFTAPVTGTYILTTVLDLRDLDDDTAIFYVILNSSNRIYYSSWDIQDIADGDLGSFSLALSAVVDMDASDECNVRVWHNGSTNVDIHTDSFFSGALLG